MGGPEPVSSAGPADTDDPPLAVDVVVLGGGMAGLTVAATLAQQGRTCAVVEVAPDVGGSALLSEGYLWTARDAEAFVAEDPGGDVDRYRIMRAGLEPALSWVEGLGVQVSGPILDMLGFGWGRQIDVRAYVARCVSVIESAGGFVLRNTHAISAVREGTAPGALVITIESAADGTGELACAACVITTGGFQASPDRRREWMGLPADAVLVRSNPHSDGAGIALGLALGAALGPPAGGFYGHLLPYPMTELAPADYSALAQLYSGQGLLVGTDGSRFADESLGDHVNAIEVADRRRALLVVDQRVTREHVVRPFLPGMDAVDRMALGADRGAHYAVAASVEELADAAAPWGYDAAALVSTLHAFNRAMAEDLPLPVPRARNRNPLVEPPFAALEVQAAVTFTYRGLATDVDGRVLGSDGRPVPGLYAAGVDAGGVNHRGYTGGLVRGLSLGRHAAATLHADLGRSLTHAG